MKKLYEMFLHISRGKQIATAVCLIHLITLFSLICHHLISSTFKPVRPIVVKTIALAPLAPKPATTQPKPKQNPLPIASKPKPAPANKTTPTPQPKKTASESTIKNIAKSFDAITQETTANLPRTTLNIPTKLSEKIVEEEIATEDPTYGEYLIAYLERMLNFPEYGDVRVEIEIDASGKLVESRILESKSTKNAQFLKEELTLLSYPIPHLDAKQSSKKFQITFKNR